MSRRQLHEAERGAVATRSPAERTGAVMIRDATAARSPVRSCGMEALGVAQHRTKVKLRKAVRTWASMPSNVMPYIQSWSLSTGDVCGVKLRVLTQGDLSRSAWAVGGVEATTSHRCRVEKSDRFIVVMKPGNAGGAKGATV